MRLGVKPWPAIRYAVASLLAGAMLFGVARTRAAETEVAESAESQATQSQSAQAEAEKRAVEKKAAVAKEAAEKKQELLKAFASEFVEITPGQGKFPKSFFQGTGANAAAEPKHETKPDAKSGERAGAALKSESPRREVTIGSPFAMAKYEVPQSLYQAVMGSNPSVWGGPRNSVEMMTWREAVVFCQRATAQLREAKLIADDEVIRLPTESEWEYCCRAGTDTAYSFGDSARGPDDVGLKASRLDPYGWHTGNAAGNDPPVGALMPNAWGLYDFHGYLWEYVADAWHGDYDGAPTDGLEWRDDAAGPAPQRVIRGGSWRDRHDLLRSATRQAIPDHVRSDAIGFRCVKTKKSL